MTASPRAVALKARVVFPADAPPIWDGCVTIQGQRIVAVGPAASCPLRDLGNVAILPGLVNAHTHLEFSDLPAPLGQPATVFPQWIRQVVDFRRQVAATSRDPLADGLRESLTAGVTTLGEIASPGWSPPSFERTPAEATVFLELIGLSGARIEGKLAEAREHLQRCPSSGGRWRPGLSPHAPYTVHPELFARAIELAATAGGPVAFHLAESREELELLQTAGGPFRSLLEDLAAWDPAAIPLGTRPLDYLRPLSKAPRALVVHGNYLDDEELDFLAAHADRMSLVYCPRTHHYFGHTQYRLASRLAKGVNVALGTDSRASNPDLSLLAEMRFAAAQHGEVPRSKILELGSLAGAKALGRQREIGSLIPGKLANLCVVALPDRDAADPHELLFESDLGAIATFCRGDLTAGSC